jgi:hypothetical protein
VLHEIVCNGNKENKMHIEREYLSVFAKVMELSDVGLLFNVVFTFDEIVDKREVLGLF